ncbi:hypothetical protein CANCADRAFT_30504 [Tortispora caseinolytica NRRL Y-17796]|uniref:Uncharacterized protein n=1 Tax=Tortispora caseinolytica NRRL Y-17796 TaxID=767744 RepID=A0A1E4TKZ1_9ASCO|nr:hypothetical protein CANCADRAFT_30504 [Tortispora caseinolytica NRRL Y-17796]
MEAVQLNENIEEKKYAKLLDLEERDEGEESFQESSITEVSEIEEALDMKVGEICLSSKDIHEELEDDHEEEIKEKRDANQQNEEKHVVFDTVPTTEKLEIEYREQEEYDEEEESVSDSDEEAEEESDASDNEGSSVYAATVESSSVENQTQMPLPVEAEVEAEESGALQSNGELKGITESVRSSVSYNRRSTPAVSEVDADVCSANGLGGYIADDSVEPKKVSRARKPFSKFFQRNDHTNVRSGALKESNRIGSFKFALFGADEETEKKEIGRAIGRRLTILEGQLNAEFSKLDGIGNVETDFELPEPYKPIFQMYEVPAKKRFFRSLLHRKVSSN